MKIIKEIDTLRDFDFIQGDGHILSDLTDDEVRKIEEYLEKDYPDGIVPERAIDELFEDGGKLIGSIIGRKIGYHNNKDMTRSKEELFKHYKILRELIAKDDTMRNTLAELAAHSLDDSGLDFEDYDDLETETLYDELARAAEEYSDNHFLYSPSTQTIRENIPVEIFKEISALCKEKLKKIQELSKKGRKSLMNSMKYNESFDMSKAEVIEFIQSNQEDIISECESVAWANGINPDNNEAIMHEVALVTQGFIEDMAGQFVELSLLKSLDDLQEIAEETSIYIKELRDEDEDEDEDIDDLI